MNAIHNTINIVNSSNSPNVLKDGNSVFVRILNQTDNPNKYIASFAGNLFEITSKEKLLPGTSFKATIKLQGKTLHLIPAKLDDTKNIENQISKLDAKSFTENNQQISNFLKNLNLPQDKVSLNLVQYFQQHQLKLDIPQIKKSRSKAKNILSKNSHNSKQTEISENDLSNLSQLDVDITQKGFSLSDEQLEKLYKALNLFENPEENTKSTDEEKNNAKEFLSLINQVKNKNSNFHWILLPFEIKIGDILYFGNIRHLINLEDKKLQKTHIFCSNDKTKYYFMIYYSYKDEKSFKQIKYFSEPNNNSKDILLLKEFFSNSQDIIDIDFSSEAKMQGLFTEDLPITIVEFNA
jgi:hypothetical protein